MKKNLLLCLLYGRPGTREFRIFLPLYYNLNFSFFPSHKLGVIRQIRDTKKKREKNSYSEKNSINLLKKNIEKLMSKSRRNAVIQDEQDSVY